jgi:hypothetical protein
MLKPKTKYSNILELINEAFSEEEKVVHSEAQELLDVLKTRQSRREIMGGAVRKVVAALNQRAKNIEAKQNF